MRSQRYFFEKENKRPVQIKAYFQCYNHGLIGCSFWSFGKFQVGTQFAGKSTNPIHQ
jgi:hypothetical protein